MRWIALVLLAACGGDTPVGGDGGNNGGDGSSSGDAAPPTCAPPATFADGLTPTRVLHVAANAAPGGDGSSGAPFQNIEQAAAAATPGTAIRLGPGTHEADQFVSALHGTADAPIWIGGEPGQAKPVISGGATAIQLQRANFVVIHDLEVSGATANGINLDDGGMFDDETAAQYLAVERVFVHDIGTGGNNDCLKVSGLNHLWVYDSHFEDCGAGGSGVDHVGCHHTVIADNVFDGAMSTAVQAKGGSTDIDIRGNRIAIEGQRAFNLGGSTDLTLFRPSLSTSAPNAEARRIRAFSNFIITTNTSGTPFAFVGCVDCVAAHNLARGQQRWHLRILQETATQDGYTFEPSSNGRVINNSFVFTAASLSTAVNIGADTAPETFTFSNNLWVASDDPSASAPTLPVAETGGVVGGATGYGDALDAWDPHAALPDFICRDAAERNAGAPLPELTGNARGECFEDPRPIGPLNSGSCTLL